MKAEFHHITLILKKNLTTNKHFLITLLLLTILLESTAFLSNPLLLELTSQGQLVSIRLVSLISGIPGYFSIMFRKLWSTRY